MAVDDQVTPFKIKHPAADVHDEEAKEMGVQGLGTWLEVRVCDALEFANDVTVAEYQTSYNVDGQGQAVLGLTR